MDATPVTRWSGASTRAVTTFQASRRRRLGTSFCNFDEPSRRLSRAVDAGSADGGEPAFAYGREIVFADGVAFRHAVGCAEREHDATHRHAREEHGVAVVAQRLDRVGFTPES